MCFGNMCMKIGCLKFICGWLGNKIFHVEQDTNAIVENYLPILKVWLKVEKNMLVGHHSNWCIHELIRDVFIHYWY